MTPRGKLVFMALLGGGLLLGLLLVQWREVYGRLDQAGLSPRATAVPKDSRRCVACHEQTSPAVVAHWRDSAHAREGVGCVQCHGAEEGRADAFDHGGRLIATVVTPLDCAACHPEEAHQFAGSLHAAAGAIEHSLPHRLAKAAGGSPAPFAPHSPTPGLRVEEVEGLAGVLLGCQQCHGSKVALQAVDGGMVTADELRPGPDGKPTNPGAVARVRKDDTGKPLFHPGTWPNTGIGRINLDGSLGACSACHSRHDFSPRRARKPEGCGRCHMGPAHAQKEIYEASKHGAAFRDLTDLMNLDAESWVLGRDYAHAPTCATCHMSGHLRNDGRITHDAGERISWNNRPPVSPLYEDAAVRRARMQEVCSHCHTPDFIEAFYLQYDALVVLYNEKFAKPGQDVMDALYATGLLTETPFDEEIEWTWFRLWHHDGRRARHGASMMAPGHTQQEGMAEVARRFYTELLPQARRIARRAEAAGRTEEAARVLEVVDGILRRPEHAWKEGR